MRFLIHLCVYYRSLQFHPLQLIIPEHTFSPYHFFLNTLI